MPTSTTPPQPKNFGPLTNLITGIQGVAAGGQASINMNCGQRIHSETFQCSGIAYGKHGTPVATPLVAGTETFTVVVSANGQIASIAINNATTAKGAGTYTGSILDPLYTALNGNQIRVGQGATFSYVVNGANTVTSVTLTNAGVVSPIPPEDFFTSQKHIVNGAVIRDIGANRTIQIAMCNGYAPADGELPVFFTEPWRKIVDHDQATAWDLIGQSTYQIIFGIATGITSPTLNGVYCFDYLRNSRMVNGQEVLFLRPIKQHEFSYNVPGGIFNVTSLPVDYPIQRMFLFETGQGSISYVELYQDGNKIIEGSYLQNAQTLKQYGFVPTVVDFPIIFDKDQRLGEALSVDNLVLRVTSNAAATLGCVVEIQGDNYS